MTREHKSYAADVLLGGGQKSCEAGKLGSGKSDGWPSPITRHGETIDGQTPTISADRLPFSLA